MDELMLCVAPGVGNGAPCDAAADGAVRALGHDRSFGVTALVAAAAVRG